MSWIINLLPIVGCAIVAIISSFFGRKAGLIASTVPVLILFSLFYFTATGSDKLWLAIAQRSLFLVGIGGFYLVAPIYLCELLSPTMRDFIFYLPVIFSLLANIIFDFCRTWSPTMEIITAIIFTTLVVTTCWLIPESPYWLVRVWKREQAGFSLKKLFGDDFDSETKIKTISQLTRDSKKPFLKIFCSANTMKPIGLLLAMIFLLNCAGESTIRFLTPNILVPATTLEILGNVIPLIVTVFVLFIARRVRKRNLLMTSGSIIFVALTIKAVVKYVDLDDIHGDYYSTITKFDAVSLVMFNIGFAVGYQIIIWVLFGELLVLRGKELSAAMLVIFYTLTRFGVVQFFHYAFGKD